MKPAGKDYTELFSQSYLRIVVSDPASFFVRFYELFRKADPQVERLFSRTDMDRQLSMIEESLLYMIDFSRSRVASNRLEALAGYHGRKKMNIPARLFDVWMECLVATLRERDPELSPEIETAWRVILAPGLAYMKAHTSASPSRSRAKSTRCAPEAKRDTIHSR